MADDTKKETETTETEHTTESRSVEDVISQGDRKDLDDARDETAAEDK